MKRRILFIFFMSAVLLLGENSGAQVTEKPVQPRPGIARICEEIERGIGKGEVKIFSQHFARQLSVNIRNGENGYFSANQAYYLLKNFFGARQVVHFKFTTFGEAGNIPFATGGGSFTFHGGRETVQIYVSFRRIGDRWLISQFNAY